jgi:hypothetical protein
MSIKQDIIELQKLNGEVSRMLKSLKEVREAKRILESRVSEYIQRENLPAIKDSTRGVVIRLNKQQRSVIDKPKKERDQNALDLLSEAGVDRPQELLDKLRKVGKNMVEKRVIKIDKM